jgi:hypothetical protein
MDVRLGGYSGAPSSAFAAWHLTTCLRTHHPHSLLDFKVCCLVAGQFLVRLESSGNCVHRSLVELSTDEISQQWCMHPSNCHQTACRHLDVAIINWKRPGHVCSKKRSASAPNPPVRRLLQPTAFVRAPVIEGSRRRFFTTSRPDPAKFKPDDRVTGVRCTGLYNDVLLMWMVFTVWAWTTTAVANNAGAVSRAMMPVLSWLLECLPDSHPSVRCGLLGPRTGHEESAFARRSSTD